MDKGVWFDTQAQANRGSKGAWRGIKGTSSPLEGECKLWWFTFGVIVVIYAWCVVFKCLWWII